MVNKLFGIAIWKMPALNFASILQSLCNPNQEKMQPIAGILLRTGGDMLCSPVHIISWVLLNY